MRVVVLVLSLFALLSVSPASQAAPDAEIVGATATAT